MAKITGNELVNSFGYTERISSPYGGNVSEIVNKVSHGLTIRQYYAGLMLQGLLTDTERAKNFTLEGIKLPMIQLSVAIADALIAELNKSENEKETK